MQIPPQIKKQVERMMMQVLVGAIEKLLALPEDKQKQALEDLRFQATTGKVRPGAFITFQL